MIEELMEHFDDPDTPQFDREEVKEIQSRAIRNDLYDVIEQDRFIQSLKEMSDEDQSNICFECKVIQMRRSRHCY